MKDRQFAVVKEQANEGSGRISVVSTVRAGVYRAGDRFLRRGQQPWGTMSQARREYEQNLLDRSRQGVKLSNQEKQYLGNIDSEWF